jgi:hypothetical protein
MRPPRRRGYPASPPDCTRDKRREISAPPCSTWRRGFAGGSASTGCRFCPSLSPRDVCGAHPCTDNPGPSETDGHTRRRSRPCACGIRPGVPCLVLPALHAYAAGGFPEDRGEPRLATDNAQPVPCEANPIGDARNTQLVTMSRIGEQRMSLWNYSCEWRTFSSVKGYKIRVWYPRRPRGALRGLDHGLAATGGAGSRAYAARRCPISPGEKGQACSIARNTIVCMSPPLANGSPCRTDSSLGRAGRYPSRRRAVIAAWP